MGANKKIEVNEALVAEYQKQEFLWHMKYKDCNTRENALRTLVE